MITILALEGCGEITRGICNAPRVVPSMRPTHFSLLYSPWLNKENGNYSAFLKIMMWPSIGRSRVRHMDLMPGPGQSFSLCPPHDITTSKATSVGNITHLKYILLFLSLPLVFFFFFFFGQLHYRHFSVH